MEQYYHVILVRRDHTTTQPTMLSDSACPRECPPPPWSAESAPSPPPELASLTAKFDALDQ